jgi:predicted phosphodiesterase
LRIFTVSDIHVDFEENLRWFQNLSRVDYTDDLLILAGDVTDSLLLLEKTLQDLKERFREVFFIPGNHDLWVRRNPMAPNSLEKLQLIRAIAAGCGIRMEPFHWGTLSIIPLYSWYDYSLAEPTPETFESWADFIACKWPVGFDEKRITGHFLEMNEPFLSITNQFIISFSHFLPRIDLMPDFIPSSKQSIYPVLGTSLLETQIRRLGSGIHVYGHSHVNTRAVKDNVLYINNAFGYPYETMITAKKLKCVYEI